MCHLNEIHKYVRIKITSDYHPVSGFWNVFILSITILYEYFILMFYSYLKAFSFGRFSAHFHELSATVALEM